MYTVTLRRVADGLERTYNEQTLVVSAEVLVYLWTEGNYSCDCNRYLFFCWAGGEEPEGDEDAIMCGEGAYVLTCLRIGEKVLVVENEPVSTKGS